jgi:hypothetical protein
LSQNVESKSARVTYRDRWAFLSRGVRTLLTVKSNSIGTLFFALLCVWAGHNWFLTAQKIVRYYSPLPNWDYWNVVQHLPAYRAFDIGVLWQQHNEHRIVFPEMVFAFDMLFLHGRQVLPLVISFVFYLSNWFVMSWVLLLDKSLPASSRYIAVLMGGIIIGWQGSAAALGIPFLLNWTLSQFASVFALALISRFARTSRISYLIGTIVCGTVASYSSANGLVLWPVILVSGVVLSLSSRYIAVIALAAIANVGLYFIGYRVSNALNLSTLLSHPLYFLGYVSSYVSMPFGAIEPARFGVIVGSANLVLFIALAAIAARTRSLSFPAAIVLFGYSAFTLLTAVLTAAGRMNPIDTFFISAKASRYVTVPLVNWGALVMVLIWLSGRSGWKAISPTNITLTALVLGGVAFSHLGKWLWENDVVFARQQWATLSVENGLVDPELIQYVFPDLNFFRLYVPLLRDGHLSIFSRGYGGSLGQSVASRFSGPVLRRQPGAITRAVSVPGGLEIVGWADGSRSQRVIFVNEAGQIAGFGGKLPAGFPPDLQSDNTPSSLAWVGFINSRIASRSFSTYVIDRHRKRLAPIGNMIVIPANPHAPADETHPPPSVSRH